MMNDILPSWMIQEGSLHSKHEHQRSSMVADQKRKQQHQPQQPGGKSGGKGKKDKGKGKKGKRMRPLLRGQAIRKDDGKRCGQTLRGLPWSAASGQTLARRACPHERTWNFRNWLNSPVKCKKYALLDRCIA
jgi:hypothetical protein